MQEVEILVQTITQMYGVLSQGDILRTSPEFAKHLVEDCAAAKYVGAAPVVDAGDEAAEEDPKSLTVPQLKEALTARGIQFDATAKKADLQALLDAPQ